MARCERAGGEQTRVEVWDEAKSLGFFFLDFFCGFFHLNLCFFVGFLLPHIRSTIYNDDVHHVCSSPSGIDVLQHVCYIVKYMCALTWSTCMLFVWSTCVSKVVIPHVGAQANNLVAHVCFNGFLGKNVCFHGEYIRASPSLEYKLVQLGARFCIHGRTVLLHPVGSLGGHVSSHWEYSLVLAGSTYLPRQKLLKPTNM